MKKLTLITIVLTLTSVLFTSCSKEEGCTDPAATNFNIDAESDDGSCVYAAVTEPDPEVKTTITVNFSHNFDGVPVSGANFNQFNYVNQNGDTLSITRLRYLISDLALYKPNGDSILLDDYQLVDLSDPSTMSFTISNVDLGAYSAIGFTWGFDSLDNQGNYVDLNSVSWNWPTMIGGGYHFLQFDGQWMNNGTPAPFNFHNGTASQMSVHEANHVDLRLPGIALNETYASVELKMNIAEFFKNPYTWDFSVYSTMLMPNYTAQKLIHDQMYSVFSLGSVTQRRY